jgi:hypothetical protein
MAGERAGPAGMDPRGMDARLMADMILGATLGQLHLQALILDVDQDTLQRQLKERVDRVIDTFLRSADLADDRD